MKSSSKEYDDFSRKKFETDYEKDAHKWVIDNMMVIFDAERDYYKKHKKFFEIPKDEVDGLDITSATSELGLFLKKHKKTNFVGDGVRITKSSNSFLISQMLDSEIGSPA